MREISKGFTAFQTFCAFMNIPTPMAQKPFLEMQTKCWVESNMKSAAHEVRKADGGHEITDDEIVSTTISTDGTLQRRGFSSKWRCNNCC